VNRFKLIQILRSIKQIFINNNKSIITVNDCLLFVRVAQMLSQHTRITNKAGIVFSMDRAMQLHALLGSYRENVINRAKLTVIYRVTSETHDEAYKAVFSEFSELIETVVRQESRESFRELVIGALRKSKVKNVFFLVDDNMFIEPVDLDALANHATTFSIPTLRLGVNLNRSYALQKNQDTPLIVTYQNQSNQKKAPTDLLAWRWNEGQFDWGYPLSVDGHIFQRDEILALAESINFDSPNTFEGNLQQFITAFQWRLGICYRKSRLINIPFNRVQTEYNNIHGEVHQDYMLEKWNDGYRMYRR